MSSFLSQQASLPPLLANVHSYASGLFTETSTLSFVTNSVLVALVVMGIVLWFSRKATKNMTLVPHKAQNFLEFIVEFLYNQVVGIVGEKQARLAFPLLGTLFIYILISNWFGLLPGVGTIGWGKGTGFLSIDAAHDPLLRPPTADLNATVGIAVSSFLVWLFLTIKEIGVWGFIVHTFGPKGGLKGVMGMVVAVVFLFVGVIEVVSIVIRPVTLSIRLYGNIFAGENVIHAMSDMMNGTGAIGSFLGSIILPLPFYFMELLVGLLQAIVFTLLCSVYIQLSTTHDDHGHEEEHH
ncbi:MAG: F0F1 ATP synthase subunit A [Prosthecobacter sp.]|uniref:F0F1 ATP synthase subunit A n=1 Tax=Prosthecobacter sp. TaxID=1965333 RepID=UPI0025CC4B76|nr:F0F1 ATP synthase subunit A [Prosthecobacter sp.]MCF7788019.1 F0F1 ATP synthase subunit A [Prosthecobacter sp.]